MTTLTFLNTKSEEDFGARSIFGSLAYFAR
jgi:hypothetical protein